VFVERLSVERELVSDDERGQWPFTVPAAYLRHLIDP